MERLTERDFQGNKLVLKNSVECTTENIKKWSVNKSAIGSITIRGEAVDKLAAYEDAEEQGLLLRLPCKLGDKVYILAGRYGTFYEEDICDGFYIGRDGELQVKAQNNKGNHGTYGVIGKTAFLTQDEAEQKLKEMKS